MKKSRQYLKIITTWCFTIFALDSVYIGFSFYGFNGSAASSLTTSQRNSCITIGVLLHYFLLTTFFFSLSITIIQYLIFYHSFKIFKFIYLKAAGFSFGKFELNLIMPKNLGWMCYYWVFFSLFKRNTAYYSRNCISYRL